MIGKKIATVSLTALLFAGTLPFTACNKQLDVNSTRQSDEAKSWKTIDDARSSLMGIYGLFRAAVADNNAHWLFGELRNGDFTALKRPDLKAIIEGKLNASYPVIESIANWRRFYAAINACNLFIERSGEALADTRYTEINHKVDVAQARVLRAFMYYYIVRIWGDVPLLTKSYDNGSFKQFPRSSKEDVLGFAVREIEEAAPMLPFAYGAADPKMPGEVYHTKTYTEWKNMLINKVSAYAILAHITALQGNYYATAGYTDYVMQNYNRIAINYLSVGDLTGRTGIFNELADDLGTDQNQFISFNFLRGMGELSVSGHIEQLTLAYPLVSKQSPDIYITKDTLASMFPTSNGQDLRFGTDTSSVDQGTPTLYRNAYITNYGEEIPIFSKVKSINAGVAGEQQFNVFTSAILFTRLEEIVLLRAEALAVLGHESDAATLLNNIRSRRNVKAFDGEEAGADLIKEIFEERRRELVGEGWRWYDLVRYNKIKKNNPAFNALISNGGIYWPVSRDVLNNNALITQNNYWK
ncbi:RagB/SusD family nutrient uptake outer membrane protein [Paraflavitalea sp. CAU 1676]|uniref:RagB/SusD family nutrient uptake outer membrane protein n=1 Tax=Paraflavitalea sp. CAU 1676 TaxID=3032598 RepID=UPI0023DA6093|nr:RagB/SusD family nutrient uptake outer membrane protein [Paraflavitalea sp. CAU 1676]MDF2188073.1 RagB/SusD family nutrient uptake outer membrane protein [Paraflavitalea sp. CAU 1676]